ncbi:hypothetical protein Afil01_30220 [Actinorhabdospora filicis]|uniref:Uncharacterized protein n=1 Tax=Actinorhabdospora filicis TaxID=1785913 RepID=A0A9W6WB04_9ACTN|nr:hypothetical protein [Actinorhabdospora filicis]GLZ78215.1 hypothetical protein Afil01_30220 [Actinorhabdospora filicis]
MIVIVLICAVMLPLTTFQVRRVWAGRQKLFAPPGFIWFWGDGSAATAAYRRSVPALGVGFGSVCIAALGSGIWPLMGGAGKPFLAVICAIFLPVFFAAAVIGFWTIPLFNRPKMLVPPMYRDEDGIIAARRKARSAPTARDPKHEWRHR